MIVSCCIEKWYIIGKGGNDWWMGWDSVTGCVGALRPKTKVINHRDYGEELVSRYACEL